MIDSQNVAQKGPLEMLKNKGFQFVDHQSVLEVGKMGLVKFLSCCLLLTQFHTVHLSSVGLTADRAVSYINVISQLMVHYFLDCTEVPAI